MRNRLIAELIFLPLCVLAIVSAYFNSLEAKRSAHEALIEKSTELSLGGARFIVDFMHLEVAARRLVLNDPTFRPAEFDMWMGVAYGRAALLDEGDFAQADDPDLARIIARARAAFDRIRQADADPQCDRMCLAQAVVRATPRLKRSLTLLQTHSFKIHAQTRHSLRATITDVVNRLMRLSTIAIVGGCALILYFWRRYVFIQRSRERLIKSHAKVLEVSQYRANFLAGVSHEFRTPLNAIKGFAQLGQMVGDTASRAQLLEYLEDIERSAHNLEMLTNNVLDLSQIDSGSYTPRLEEVGLRACAAQILKQFSAAGQETERFDLRIDPNLRLTCDAEALRRCVDNIVSNAVKYSPAGSLVIVEAREAGDFIEISVTDHGRGVPLEEQETIWELYARASYVRSSDIQGTGVGLALTKSLVEAHGGRVALRSVVNQGSTVTLAFPKRAEERVEESSDVA